MTKIGFACAISISAMIIGFSFLYYQDNSSQITGEAFANYWSSTFTAASFVWLVVGYFMQGVELSLQRKEIAHAIAEMGEQAKAQRAQAASALAQAELARQSVAANARKEFLTQASLMVFNRLNAAVDRIQVGPFDNYGIMEALVVYDDFAPIWNRYQGGQIDAFIRPAVKLLKSYHFVCEREIAIDEIDKLKLNEDVGHLFLNLLLFAGKYGATISAAEAERYDQRPFDEICYRCWDIVKLIQLLDDHQLHRHSLEVRSVVSGSEWIRRSDIAGIEDGIRYVFEGDVVVFGEVAVMLQPFHRPPHVASAEPV